jgi:uncharacterized OB-fold protein
MSGVAFSESAVAYPAFWQAARSGRLEVQRCSRCGALRYFPAPLCPACLSADSAFAAMSGKATLYAFTTVHRAPTAALAKETPYTIAFVELAEGPRVMARLEDIPSAGAKIGDPVTFAGVGDSGAGCWLRFRYGGTTR